MRDDHRQFEISFSIKKGKIEKITLPADTKLPFATPPTMHGIDLTKYAVRFGSWYINGHMRARVLQNEAPHSIIIYEFMDGTFILFPEQFNAERVRFYKTPDDNTETSVHTEKNKTSNGFSSVYDIAEVNPRLGLFWVKK